MHFIWAYSGSPSTLMSATGAASKASCREGKQRFSAWGCSFIYNNVIITSQYCKGRTSKSSGNCSRHPWGRAGVPQRHWCHGDRDPGMAALDLLPQLIRAIRRSCLSQGDNLLANASRTFIYFSPLWAKKSGLKTIFFRRWLWKQLFFLREKKLNFAQF